MAKKRLRKLRRKVLGRTTAGRLTRAAGLAGLIGGGGFLASRKSSPGSSSLARGVSAAPIATPSVAPSATPTARPSNWKSKSGTRRRAPAQPPNLASRRRVVPAAPTPVRPRAASKKRLAQRYERLQSMADGDVPGVSQAGRAKADKLSYGADRRTRQYGKNVLPSRKSKSGTRRRAPAQPRNLTPKKKNIYQQVGGANTRLERGYNRTARGISRGVIASVDKEDSGRGGLISKANRPIKSRKNAVEVPKYRAQLEANRVKRNAAEKRLQSLPKAKPRGQRVRRGSTTPRRPPRRLR